MNDSFSLSHNSLCKLIGKELLVVRDAAQFINSVGSTFRSPPGRYVVLRMGDEVDDVMTLSFDRLCMSVIRSFKSDAG